MYILPAELDFKVPYEYLLIYSGIDLIPPHTHGNVMLINGQIEKMQEGECQSAEMFGAIPAQ